MKPALAILAAMLACALLPLSAAAQTSVQLRQSARVQPGAAVTLGDAAFLSGPEAEKIAQIVLIAAEHRSSTPTLGIDQVRRILRAHPEPINWGLLTISGSTCTIMDPLAAAPPTPKDVLPAAPQTPTVRAAVESRLSGLFDAPPADLRLEFDAADHELLDMSAVGRTIDIRAVGASDRIPLAITVYEGDPGNYRIAASATIRVGVMVRRDVAIASASFRRGEIIGPGQATVDSQWMAPTVRAIPLDRAVGSAVRSRLAPGMIITDGDVEAPIAVRRGELVSVHCVSGSVVLRTTGRAAEDARDGEIVKLTAPNDSKRWFLARMSGRGRAVAVTHNEGPEPSGFDPGGSP